MQELPRRRPGERIIRRALIRPIRIALTARRPKPSRPLSPLILFYAFGVIIAIGTFALSLPISTEGGGWTPFMDAFFTSTSATTVTGLTVVDTATAWTPFGKGVILVLIQVGGLGIMTISTLLILAVGRRVGLRERFTLSMESSGRATFGGAVRLVRTIALVVLIAEVIGVIAFTARFSFDHPFPTALWHGVFHSVSSFNNAGFVVLPGEGIQAYQSDLSILLITAALIMAGGISYAVIMNVLAVRRFGRLSLDTKLVLTMSLALWAVGMVVIFASEYSNDATMGAMSVGDKLANSFFETTSGRTAGFESVSVAAMREYTWLALMGLMFIGGAAGSAVGGIKVATFALILASVWATIRGRPRVELFKRQIPSQQVSIALAIGALGLAIILGVVFVLAIVEDVPLVELLFETVSAFGTVGNSTGVTAMLSVAGQVLIALTMFVGKIGPVTLMLALSQRARPTLYQYGHENVRIG